MCKLIERLKMNFPFGMLPLMGRQVKSIRLNYIGSYYEVGRFKVEIDFTDNYLFKALKPHASEIDWNLQSLFNIN